MRVLLPTKRSSCTQRRTPRHIENRFGALWHLWVAARKEDDREKRQVGQTQKARCHRPPPRRGKRAVFEGEGDGSEWRNARAKGFRRLLNRRSHRASLHTRQNQIADLMEITSDKDAERANVLCWFKQVGHHYGHHASRRR